MWFNIDNLKILLFSNQHILKKLLEVKVLDHSDDPAKREDDETTHG